MHFSFYPNPIKQDGLVPITYSDTCFINFKLEIFVTIEGYNILVSTYPELDTDIEKVVNPYLDHNGKPKGGHNHLYKLPRIYSPKYKNFQVTIPVTNKYPSHKKSPDNRLVFSPYGRNTLKLDIRLLPFIAYDSGFNSIPTTLLSYRLYSVGSIPTDTQSSYLVGLYNDPRHTLRIPYKLAEETAAKNGIKNKLDKYANNAIHLFPILFTDNVYGDMNGSAYKFIYNASGEFEIAPIDASLEVNYGSKKKELTYDTEFTRFKETGKVSFSSLVALSKINWRETKRYRDTGTNNGKVDRSLNLPSSYHHMPFETLTLEKKVGYNGHFIRRSVFSSKNNTVICKKGNYIVHDLGTGLVMSNVSSINEVARVIGAVNKTISNNLVKKGDDIADIKLHLSRYAVCDYANYRHRNIRSSLVENQIILDKLIDTFINSGTYVLLRQRRKHGRITYDYVANNLHDLENKLRELKVVPKYPDVKNKLRINKVKFGEYTVAIVLDGTEYIYLGGECFGTMDNLDEMMDK